MTERLTLPVLPLREVVLFPGVTAPIGAGRPATLRAIESALSQPDRLVFAVSQRENVESVTPEVLYTIGTVARIGQLQRGLAGVQLLLHGEQRGIAMHITETDGYLQAIVREAEEMPPLNVERSGLRRPLPRGARARRGAGPEVRPARRGRPAGAGRGDRAGPLRRPGRRLHRHHAAGAAVAAGDPVGRGAAAPRAGARPAPDRGARGAGRDQVAGPGRAGRAPARDVPARAAQGRSRRSWARTTSATSCEELREKLATLELPEEARKEVDRELGRLGRIGPRVHGGPGHPDLPRDHRRAALEHAQPRSTSTSPRRRRILDEDHYALGDVKDRVLEFLAVRQLRAQADGQTTGRRTARTPADGQLRRRRGRGDRVAAATATMPTPNVRCQGNDDDAPRARSCCSSALRASARPRSPSRSPGPWAGSTSASRSAACATRPTSAATGAPTWAPCPAGSSRA